jgi:hypothetical protein
VLRALGARTVPVVARGTDWVSGQSLDAISRLVGLDETHAPELPAATLIERLDTILAGAQRFVRQLPHEQLGQNVRNRKRSLRVLGHHVFRIPEAFLECATSDIELAYDALVAPPDASIDTGDDIARYGETVRAKLRDWWSHGPDATSELRTYYGPQSLHQLLERTTWHSGQHVRQLMMILETAGIAPDGPLADETFAGLPMPEKVWDDE